MFRKLMIGITAILMILAFMGGMTLAQFLPFMVFFVLAYFYDKESKEEDLLKINHKLNFWIVLLACVMAMLNFVLAIDSPYAFVDVAVWILIAIAWWK